MKKLFIGCALVLLSVNSYAFKIQSYKTTGSSITVIDAKTVTDAFNSNVPFCLKEGGKVITVNDAFLANKLVYADCSTSDKRLRIHKAEGIKVNVFKLSSLPMDMIKSIKAKLKGAK